MLVVWSPEINGNVHEDGPWWGEVDRLLVVFPNVFVELLLDLK